MNFLFMILISLLCLSSFAKEKELTKFRCTSDDGDVSFSIVRDGYYKIREGKAIKKDPWKGKYSYSLEIRGVFQNHPRYQDVVPVLEIQQKSKNFKFVQKIERAFKHEIQEGIRNSMPYTRDNFSIGDYRKKEEKQRVSIVAWTYDKKKGKAHIVFHKKQRQKEGNSWKNSPQIDIDLIADCLFE